MTDSSTIIRQRQLAIRREMDRRGLALKQVSFDSGIPYATLLSYFPQEGSRDPAIMPASAIYSAAEKQAIPNDLLSLLLPETHMIVSIPTGMDLDEIEALVRDFLQEKANAHHLNSPAGRDISICEDNRLSAHPVVVRLAG